MTRETLLRTPTPAGDDGERDLRPQRMREMVGQHEVYERLHIAVDAAIKRQEALGHILFDGPPGLGKTTFALCLPREMDVDIQTTTGATLQAPKDLIPYLTNAGERSILFIDEIHRLPAAVEEYLYTAMEDFRIDIVHGEGTHARTLNLWLKPFTLVGATTRSGNAVRAAARPLPDSRAPGFLHARGTGGDCATQRQQAVGRHRSFLHPRDCHPQPRHPTRGQQSAPLGPRLCNQPCRRPYPFGRYARRRWKWPASMRSACAVRTASTWKH